MAAADGSMDSDGDGLTDGREFYLYGTDMNLWDTDGDSYSDGEELQWGTNPLDIQNMPRLGRGVVINEILYNPTGTDTGKEWAELFNTNRVPVNLTDFIIQVGSNAFNNTYTFPTNTILNSGDFLLVGGSLVANANHIVELNMLNRGSSGPTAGIRLVSPASTSNHVVDTLLYAPTNSFNLPTTAFGTDGFAPWAAAGFSVLRIKVGYDSDQASDWTFTSSPTPTALGELLDIDGDGISNATEIAGYSTAYGFLNTDYNNPDTDFDGFSDGEELTNSPPTNPLLYDTDGDAFPYSTNGIYRGNDGDEVHNMGTDPTNPDSDGDGLPDGWEVAMGYNPTNTANGTADADADFDGDGVSNIDEMNQNSNPTDINDFVSHDYRLVLYHLPKAGWQPGQDMGTKTWAGYRFDNIINTTRVAFIIADGGHTAETFSVSWEEAINDDETGGRTNIVWATLLPGTSPKMIITDGGTTWPNQNPAERGADLSVEEITTEMTAYRPQTETYANPFQRRAIPSAQEESPGAGIRVNGDDDNNNSTADRNDTTVNNENDLIEVVLNAKPPINSTSGFKYVLKRSSSNIKAWSTQTKQTALLDANNETNLTFVTTPKTVWVECPTGGVANLELQAKTDSGAVISSDMVHFYPFASVVIALGGEDQVPAEPVNEPGNHGIFELAIDLYQQGYDVHMYDEDNVLNTGLGAVYNEAVRAVQYRGVTQVAIYGYSHGGGSTHDLAERLDADRATIGTFSIPFTAYIDAVQNDSDFDVQQETRRPPATAFHVNYYQEGSFADGFLDGGPIDAPGADHEVNVDDPTSTHTHFTVDDDANVLDGIETRLTPRVIK